jgi:hypothetical protein
MRARGHGNRYERRHGRADRNRGCARRVEDQQCAVAGLLALEPWASTRCRTVGACSVERQAAAESCDHEGLHLGGARGPVYCQLPSSMSHSEGLVSVRRGSR